MLYRLSESCYYSKMNEKGPQYQQLKRNKKESESEPEQMDLFFENDSELKEKFERVKYKVSILGGVKSENQAETLGYELTKNWFSVVTGGYNSGTMRKALEGSDRALEEMKKEDKNKDALSLFNPTIKGITAERFAPSVMAAKGKNIKTEIAEGNYDIYLRLGKLIEDSNVVVVLPGDTGTEVEVMANMHFDKKLKGMFELPNRPVIFIDDEYNQLLESKFKEIVEGSDKLYEVTNENEAVDLIEKLFKKEQLSKQQNTVGELDELQKELTKKILRF